jgi:phage recombination protein Bet
VNELTPQADNVPQPTSLSPATIQTVKDTIFKGANDAELQLYFHKCLAVGCHPLDQLIHPSKFQDGQGGTRVVFLTTIDLFRARAQDTGEYDGQDEPEFEYGELEEGDFIHPTYCRVNVYKKEISRPTVGTADWNEFYPTEAKKQFMWKKMPKVMLAKCAEAQGLRKAFPQALNKLYAEEEMMQAIRKSSLHPESTKPVIKKQTEIIDEKNYIEEVSVKNGTSKKGLWKKYGVKIKGEYYGTFSETIGEAAIKLKESKTPVKFEFKKDGKFMTLISITGITPPVKKENVVPVVEDSEDFKLKIRQLASQAGQETDEDINEFLTERGFPVLDEIPADKQNGVADMYIAMGCPADA